MIRGAGVALRRRYFQCNFWPLEAKVSLEINKKKKKENLCTLKELGICIRRYKGICQFSFLQSGGVI